jgi:hypothetical protein
VGFVARGFVLAHPIFSPGWEQQIPFGNDNKKSNGNGNGNGKSNSGFALG